MDYITNVIIIGSIILFSLRVFAPAQYITFGWIVEIAVRAAEQRYKETGGAIARRPLAKKQIAAKLKWFGFKPDKYSDIIDELIDAAITKLDKTKPV